MCQEKKLAFIVVLGALWQAKAFGRPQKVNKRDAEVFYIKILRRILNFTKSPMRDIKD